MVIPWAERGAPTKLPPAQWADRLVATWRAETGASPPRELAELLFAQVILETDWSRAMWRFNWGNITAGSSWKGDILRPPWFEEPGPDASKRIRDLHAAMLSGQAPKAFRVYPSHEAGAADYIRILHTKFAPMLVAAATGDPKEFGAAVRTTGYCPDCGESFERSLQTVQTQIRNAGWFAGLSSDLNEPDRPRSGFGGAVPAVALIALTGAAAYGAYKARPRQRRRRQYA